MLSRGAFLCRIVANKFASKPKVFADLQLKRGSHAVSYRVAPPPHSKTTLIGAEFVGAAMWWWILWHLWHEYEHITGEFEYPDPSSWSNSELGIY